MNATSPRERTVSPRVSRNLHQAALDVGDLGSPESVEDRAGRAFDEPANLPSQPFRANDEDEPAAEQDEQPEPDDQATDDHPGRHRHATVQPLGDHEHDAGNDEQSEPAELIEDPVQKHAPGRGLGGPAPAPDDHPQHGHVPRSERDARTDPGEDQVPLGPANDAETRDERREDRPGQDPGDEPEHADHEQVLDGEPLERVDDLLVVDEPGHDDAEDHHEDPEDEANPQDRGASTRRLRLGQGRWLGRVGRGGSAGQLGTVVATGPRGCRSPWCDPPDARAWVGRSAARWYPAGRIG